MWSIVIQILSGSLILSGIGLLVLFAEFILASASQLRSGAARNGLAWGFIFFFSSMACWVLEIIFSAVLIGGNAALGPRGIFSQSPLSASIYSMIVLVWINIAYCGGVWGMLKIRTYGRKG